MIVFAGILETSATSASPRILLTGPAESPDERTIMELHPLVGARIVERLPALEDVATAIRHHHERCDDTGYPRLGGDAIPLDARVLAVVDAYCALTSSRPYRRAVSPELACEEIERCAGTQVVQPEIAVLFAGEMRGPGGRRRPTRAASVSLSTSPPFRARRKRGEPLLGLAGPLSSTDAVALLSSHRYLQEAVDAEAPAPPAPAASVRGGHRGAATLSHINRSEGYAAGDHALRSSAGRSSERSPG